MENDFIVFDFNTRKRAPKEQRETEWLFGAMKRGWGTCGKFKAFNLTYLHVLRAGMVYITLWYMHIPKYAARPKEKLSNYSSTERNRKRL